MYQFKEEAKFKKCNVPCKDLLDGNKIPSFGLGTLNLKENDAVQVIRSSIERGFRLIDTSPVYGNEKAIGNALKECFDSGLCKREDLFVISKLWITDRNNAKDAVRQSLEALQLDYVDLYLVHYMTPDIVKDSLMVDRVSIQEVWRQLEHCVEEGLIRSIGLMNCSVIMFLEILTFCNINPTLNCLEMHPYFTQTEAMEFYKKFKVLLAAYAPICPTENLKVGVPEQFKNLDLFKESIIIDLAKKYNKTPAQIILNWHMTQEHIVFPGMRSVEEIEQNAGVFDFELSSEEIEKISSLNRCARFYDRIQDDNFSFIPYWM